MLSPDKDRMIMMISEMFSQLTGKGWFSLNLSDDDLNVEDVSI